MDKNPARRFGSMAEAAAELRAWAAGESEQPLDRPDDTEFRVAVAAAQEAERLSDGSVTDLPVQELADERWFTTASRLRTFWWAFGLAAGAALLLGLAALLASRWSAR